MSSSALTDQRIPLEVETASAALPTPAAEALTFWRLRTRLLITGVRQAVRTARLRTGLVLLLSIAFWIAMYLVFAEGFELLRTMISHRGTRAQTVHAIYNVFFLSLLIMLTMSSGIILYSALFRSRETAFLLTMPVSVRRIVLFKLQETLLLSSWGFFLLGTPLLVAYGRVAAAPWYYYVAFLPFMIAFVCIPVGLGAVLCMLVVRFIPRLRWHLLAAVLAAGGMALASYAWLHMRDSPAREVLTLEWFQSTLQRLKYSEQRLSPSWWLSTGLLEAAHPARSGAQTSWRESLGFLAVLCSNAMLMFLLVAWVGERCLVRGYSRLAGLGRARRRASLRGIDRLLATALPLPRAMRLLLVKDFQVFRRDILQWSQFAIFFALLAFYFLNIRRLHYGHAFSNWLMIVGYMNVAVIGLLLATFMTRFVYPLISLEGRRFWVLGTLPISRASILWSKFAFAVGVSVLPCAALILLSDIMLEVLQKAPLVAGMHQLSCLMLCLGLSGIAVGLGARFPNLRETSPAKISAGFGGTLALVLSVFFILATVLATAVPTCCWLDANAGASSVRGAIHAGRMPLRLGSFSAVMLGLATTVVLGLTATLIPMFSGMRMFRRLEP